MRIEIQRQVAAPAATIFELMTQLDHVAFVAPGRRREWCPEPHQRLAEGVGQVIYVSHGKHRAQLEFTTEVLEPPTRIEQVFTSWPLRGGRRVTALEPRGEATTLVSELYEWRPPFLMRSVVSQRLGRERELLEERLDRLGILAERGYAELGAEAFAGGIEPAAARLGLELALGDG